MNTSNVFSVCMFSCKEKGVINWLPAIHKVICCASRLHERVASKGVFVLSPASDNGSRWIVHFFPFKSHKIGLNHHRWSEVREEPC